MQHLKREINPWTSKLPGPLNTTGKQQDCLGMTLLHILACSTKQNIEMYRLLIYKYPETLVTKDKWGDIPLLYAIWCNAPTEIIELLVDSYKSFHTDYEFDWSGMIQTLAKRNVPFPNVERLVNTQINNFSHQEYDMQSVVTELAEHDNPAMFQIGHHRGRPTSTEVFTYLLRVSIMERLDTLGIAKWREDLENCIKSLPKDSAEGRDIDTQSVYDRLATYESIKEGTSVLELALWKSKIDESRNKRARIDEISYRDQCRVNCRADIIIRNVLPYLLPKYYEGVSMT